MDRQAFIDQTIGDLTGAAVFVFRAVKKRAEAAELKLSDEALATLTVPVMEEAYRRLRVACGDPAEAVSIDDAPIESEPNECEGEEPDDDEREPTPGTACDPERQTVINDILRLKLETDLSKYGLAALVKPTGAQRLSDVPLRHLVTIRSSLRDPKKVDGANEDGFLQFARGEIDRLSTTEARHNRAKALLEHAAEHFGFGSDAYERLEGRITGYASGQSVGERTDRSPRRSATPQSATAGGRA